ncbi:HMG-box domain-containing protein [Aspergillus affinis]|uniref:HMG-box domain-containing protein n=1 Tax=Aspergillus affinis TaxID=1070780 RepID=UPI0022FE72E8|nr:uncharacterized protein KD926_006646 [Aspergillus affinis]KAI9041572.1 hypothetical protein KD926_006646 [Aspergillus affinis]
MPLNVARGGGGALRGVYLNAVARPFRVAISQPHVRRVCLATHRGSLKPIAGAVPSVLSRQLVNTYATASQAKATTKEKTTKTPRAKKATKDASEKKTPLKRTSQKPRKVLTEKQEQMKSHRAHRKRLQELKATGLSPPKVSRGVYWNVAVADLVPEAMKTAKGPTEVFRRAIELAKNLTSEEKERYLAIAQSKREEELANYKKWVQSHTPTQIRDANSARRRLAKLRDHHVALIRDERLVKPVRPQFLFYSMERNKSGDFNHMTSPDRARKIGEEWKNLTSSEKEKYVQLRKADQERYHRECKEVYGDGPTPTE